jgi:hypothetical protein
MIALLLRLLFRQGPPPSDAKWSLYAHHLGDYMRRWILRTPWGSLRVHHILRSDDDRHLHDHPFDFTSLLLTGGYTEETPIADSVAISAEARKTLRWRIFYGRFSIVRRQAEQLHRLILSKPVWTLVVAGPKRRSWGFETPKGWIHHLRYLDEYPEVVRDRVGGSHADLVAMRERQAAQTDAERHGEEAGPA